VTSWALVLVTVNWWSRSAVLSTVVLVPPTQVASVDRAPPDGSVTWRSCDATLHPPSVGAASPPSLDGVAS
jgi:hypothetical protein